MFGEWKVQIVTSPLCVNKRIYMFKRIRGTGTQVLTKDGTIVMLNEDEKSDDMLYFAEMDDDQLQAFANAMADKGVKTNNDAKNEGLLLAKQEHLDDMRKLVFKTK